MFIYFYIYVPWNRAILQCTCPTDHQSTFPNPDELGLILFFLFVFISYNTEGIVAVLESTAVHEQYTEVGIITMRQLLCAAVGTRYSSTACLRIQFSRCWLTTTFFSRVIVDIDKGLQKCPGDKKQ